MNFFMKNSLLPGRLAGIRVFMHWAFLLLPAFIARAEARPCSSTETVLAPGGFVLALFACVASSTRATAPSF